MKKLIIFWLILTISACERDFVRGSGPTEVRLINASEAPLKGLRLRVTGQSVNVYDLAPGDSLAAIVEPTGDSHIQVEHADRAEPLRVDVYLSRSSGGRVRVVLSADSVHSVHHDVGGLYGEGGPLHRPDGDVYR